ncbi:hypothetical protein EVAR_40489_1 [Eumeta japonica]|uniref:PiggyBac transposable element-derived protein domain-containing protein n=1 Tax=Eumeta variegata TaxID=151549 RepID=A0A4C1XVX1_EUMVA|nr:hypothetical protein EVAR_40489_1 [Eumeta japonica]
MCSLYDVSRNSRRWPATVFYDMLNLSALDALCIYTANKNYESVRRRDFLVDLSLAWMKPLANRRLETKTLPRSLTFKIKDFLGIIHTENESTASTSPPSKSVRRYHDCGRARTLNSTIAFGTKFLKAACGKCDLVEIVTTGVETECGTGAITKSVNEIERRNSTGGSDIEIDNKTGQYKDEETQSVFIRAKPRAEI